MTDTANAPIKKPAARKRPAAALAAAVAPTPPTETTPLKANPKRPLKQQIAAHPTTPAKDSSKAVSKDKPSAVPARPKKPKLVRDGFTMPKDEYARIDELKLRCAKLGRPAKKSELIRAGLAWLHGATDTALLAALKAVPTLKTGRPKSNTAV